MMKPDTTPTAQANNIVPDSYDSILLAVKLLREGQVIAMPTETVYGLAADGLNATALAKIFEIKERPLFDPLILHLAEAEDAFKLARHVPEIARKLAERFWPGPLTLVLPKKEIVPDLATSGLPNVALRVPIHPGARALLRNFGGPLAAPSANKFGRISPTDAKAVYLELGDAVPLILDGGPCAVGLESTVLDLSGEKPILLRAGGIPIEEIEEITGPIERATPVDNHPLAPGQLKHHYAPRKPLKLVNTIEEIPARSDVGWLAFGSQIAAASFPGTVESMSYVGDIREAATNFFRALRKLDDHPQVNVLYAVSLPAKGLGLAINERLERAAH